MDRKIVDEVLRLFLREIHSRLEEAAKIAYAANICAENHIPAKGVSMLLDIETTLFEMNGLLNATTMLNRLAQDPE